MSFVPFVLNALAFTKPVEVFASTGEILAGHAARSKTLTYLALKGIRFKNVS